MAADVSYTPSFKTGVPEPLFTPMMVNIAATSGSNGFNWDVTADGKRFLVITAAAQHDTSPSSITVVLNWTALMKKWVSLTLHAAIRGRRAGHPTKNGLSAGTAVRRAHGDAVVHANADASNPSGSTPRGRIRS